MTRKFGWCLDNHHSGCRVHYRNYWEPEKIEECSCECHVGKKKPKLPEPHQVPKDPKAGRQKGPRRRNPSG